jgi:pimeloyl-ACP methyl ester carboxylesterase
MGSIEPIFGETNFRRIYLDLPGMGKTPTADWVKTSIDMREIVIEFINAVIGDENFLLAGNSYGGFLALGLIDAMPKRIDGVALICPLVTHECYSSGNLPARQIIYKSNELDSPEENSELKDFLDYAVMATPETFEKYKKFILPGINLANKDFLFSGKFHGSVREFDDLYKTMKFEKPACIITGKQDQAVGYSYAFELLKNFPRATFAVLDCAGHNLPIENEPLFSQLIKDWADRAYFAVSKPL